MRGASLAFFLAAREEKGIGVCELDAVWMGAERCFASGALCGQEQVLVSIHRSY